MKVHIHLRQPDGMVLACGTASMAADVSSSSDLCESCWKRVDRLLAGPKPPLGGIILLSAPLPHPDDAALRLVLAHVPGSDGSPDQWVTWLYNEGNKGFHQGHYAPTEDAGRKSWAKRLTGLLATYAQDSDDV